MPRRDPFTAACRQLAELHSPIVFDCHAHTTASDGDDTPSRLAVRAKQARLTAVAITDHDTVAGIDEAKAIAGIEIVAGVELSVSFPGREIHVLGLGIDHHNNELIKACEQIGESRRERFLGYVRALKDEGIEIPEHRVRHVLTMARSPGRRHVANLILEVKPHRTRHAIFNELLPRLKSSIPPKRLLPLADAITVIHSAKGVAVLAHPPGEFNDDHFSALAVAGLDGVEIRHPGVSLTQTDYLKRMAERHGWVITAGSDFHGGDSADRALGRIGMNSTEYAGLRVRIGR